MKKQIWINRFVRFLNLILIVLTLAAYLLPFLSPKTFPLLSVLTLILPFFLLANILFVIYWGLQFKRQIIYSLFVLIISFFINSPFYKLNEKFEEESAEDFTLMSYNVRLFNLFQWIKKDDIPSKIKNFIDFQDPDILSIQEYSSNNNLSFTNYPYKYIVSMGDKVKTGQAIFSKFRIINKGQINLPNSNNNVIYADIIKNKDTLRVYSIHLQSISISPDIHEVFDEDKSKKIFRRISKAFSQQQQQSELIQKHMQEVKYKTIICGDMNNSAYSYVYKNIKGNHQDSFVVAGAGFGKTYDFNYFPMRIDYIFVDKGIDVQQMTTHNSIKFSDHFPLSVRLKIRDN